MPWWQEEAIFKRNVALRELAERLFGNLSPAAQAERIATLAVRYAASVWRYDSESDAMRAKYRGRPSDTSRTPSHRAGPCHADSATFTRS